MFTTFHFQIVTAGAHFSFLPLIYILWKLSLLAHAKTEDILLQQSLAGYIRVDHTFYANTKHLK